MRRYVEIEPIVRPRFGSHNGLLDSRDCDYWRERYVLTQVQDKNGDIFAELQYSKGLTYWGGVGRKEYYPCVLYLAFQGWDCRNEISEGRSISKLLAQYTAGFINGRLGIDLDPEKIFSRNKTVVVHL